MKAKVDFDRCIKVQGLPAIFMVRDDSMSKVRIKHWEDYVALGQPGFAEVTQEEADSFQTVQYFRPAQRDTQHGE